MNLLSNRVSSQIEKAVSDLEVRVSALEKGTGLTENLEARLNEMLNNFIDSLVPEITSVIQQGLSGVHLDVDELSKSLKSKVQKAVFGNVQLGGTESNQRVSAKTTKPAFYQMSKADADAYFASDDFKQYRSALSNWLNNGT